MYITHGESSLWWSQEHGHKMRHMYVRHMYIGHMYVWQCNHLVILAPPDEGLVHFESSRHVETVSESSTLLIEIERELTRHSQKLHAMTTTIPQGDLVTNGRLKKTEFTGDLNMQEVKNKVITESTSQDGRLAVEMVNIPPRSEGVLKHRGKVYLMANMLYKVHGIRKRHGVVYVWVNALMRLICVLLKGGVLPHLLTPTCPGFQLSRRRIRYAWTIGTNSIPVYLCKWRTCVKDVYFCCTNFCLSAVISPVASQTPLAVHQALMPLALPFNQHTTLSEGLGELNSPRTQCTHNHTFEQLGHTASFDYT